MREPTNEEQRLMTIGQFDSLEEFLEWMNTPLTDDELFKLEEPDWEEIALREIGCFHSGSGDDNDPDVLAEMQQQADWWLEEKERRQLLRKEHESRRWRNLARVAGAHHTLSYFRAYYSVAELENVTDPNLVFDLRNKLDGAGYYDDFEVNRVVGVELDPKTKQSELWAALEPVVGRLLTQYKHALERFKAAEVQHDTKAAGEAKDDMNGLRLFKQDLGSFLRVYTFLSQIFDYANSAIEARSIFYKRLLPLLEFGREREEIDLSKVQLTHHTLKNKGKQAMLLNEGEKPKLPPITDIGSGSIQEKEKALLAEIIAKVNDLFEGELSEDDKLVQVNNVIKGKLLESDLLVQQATNNTKEQFSNSPDLASGILNAIMDAFTAHSAMSKQALDSEKVRSGLKDVLLGPAQLYEALRARGDAGGSYESRTG